MRGRRLALVTLVLGLALGAMLGRRQATLTVERDGVRHELKLDPGDPGLPAHQRLGMQFRAVEG